MSCRRWWLAVVFLCFCACACAQDRVPTVLEVSSATLPPAPSSAIGLAVVQTRPRSIEHKFWDRENLSLLVVHAGLETADLFLTHQAIATGGHELNPIARPFVSMGTGGQVAFFAGGTLASLGISYLLHKTHHHRLERVVSWYSMADSAWGVSYDLTHRGRRPSSNSALAQTPASP